MWPTFNKQQTFVYGLGVVMGSFLGAFGAQAQSHQYYDSHYRGQRNIFVSQGIESEWGRYVTTLKDQGDSAGLTEDKNETKAGWTGFGIRNDAGMEVMKFIRVGVGHTYMNMRNKNQSSEKLSGSRLNLEGKLVFDAPVFNLELGLGALASKLDYQNQLDSADFIGTGFYTTYSVNYFMTSSVSMFLQYKSVSENLRPEKGAKSIEKINTTTDNVGFGFSIWI